MGRQEWITVDLTLVLTFAAWYFGQGKVAILCGIIGGTILVVMIFFFKNDKKPPNPPSQSSEQNASPSITQNANPVINVNIGDRPQERQLKPSWDQQRRWLEATDGGRDVAKPNLTFLEPTQIRIGYGTNDWKRYFFAGQVGDPWGIVARVANDPPQAKKMADNIAAQVLYFDSQRREIARIFRACWLDNPYDQLDIPVSESHCIILAILELNRGRLHVPWWKRKPANNVSSYTGELENTGLTDALKTIEVVILSGSSEMLRETFGFEMIDGKPVVRRL